MTEKKFTEFLFGKEFNDKLEKVYDNLLTIEAEHNDFFNEENQLSKYLLISYDPHHFDIKFRDDLPKNIQDKIRIVTDNVFKND